MTLRLSHIRGFTLESFTISVGTTVRWINQDGVPHTVTSGTPGSPNGLFDGSLSLGDSYEYTFNAAGSFPYYCRFHSSMRATITVD